MAIKRRLEKRRGTVSEDEAAWLRGDRDSGFIQFKPDEELQELWDRHGDHKTMYWKPGENHPTPLDEWEMEEAE
jgi:hypothetical protein